MLSPKQLESNIAADVYLGVDFSSKNVSNSTYSLLYTTIRKHCPKQAFYQPLEVLLNVGNVRELTEEQALSIINFINSNPREGKV